MTVTVPEVISGQPTANATTNYTITTSLVPSDVIVVILGRPNLGTFTVSGLGATWTQHGERQLASTNTRTTYLSTSGVTGGGTVSLTNNTTSLQPHIVIIVIRGMSSTSLASMVDSTWYSVDLTLTGTQTTTAVNTDEGPSAVAADVGQVAIFVAGINNTTGLTFPSNPTPSSGWVDDITPGGTIGAIRVAHLILTGPVSVQANIQATFTRSFGTTMLVFGSASAPTLSSTFVGWGNPIF